ncbi:hypothetical protein [Arthrobacter sp. AFG20]|nr:hypothetical protein [Arthrobacter sp. AFG20]
MKVILTVGADDGQLNYVDAEGETYEEAKAVAKAMIPVGAKAIAIRTV